MQPLTLLLILACALPLVHSKVFPCYVGSSETRRHVEYLHRDRCRYTIMPYGEVVYTAQGYEPSLSREDREEAQRNNVHHCSPRVNWLKKTTKSQISFSGLCQPNCVWVLHAKMQHVQKYGSTHRLGHQYPMEESHQGRVLLNLRSATDLLRLTCSN